MFLFLPVVLIFDGRLELGSLFPIVRFENLKEPSIGVAGNNLESNKSNKNMIIKEK
jgi:hypothetical protein